MEKAVKLKYLNLIKDIDKSVEKLKEELYSIDLQKQALNNRLNVLEAQKEELKAHISY